MTDLEIKLIDAYWRIMDRIYNRDHLSWIIQPIVKHDNPADYGLKPKDAINSRIRYLRACLASIINEFNACKTEYLQGTREFAYLTLNSLSDQIAKLKKTIYFNYQRLKGDIKHEQYDLEVIKKIPISQICRINANNFFQVNPFRNEKSPSNSLFYYKNQNKCMDFGTGKSYDVVDVYQAINAVDFKTALKELSSL